VQAERLVVRVNPEYPPLARQARIQGTVRFRAVIGIDGRVLNVQLVSGHPLLVGAARDAVKQWVYRPTFLNTLPVNVVTSIDVNFALPGD
jgi:protein TonB